MKRIYIMLLRMTLLSCCLYQIKEVKDPYPSLRLSEVNIEAITIETCPSQLKCHTLEVPLSYEDASDQTITLAYAIHYAENDFKNAPTLFINYGGPGISTIHYFNKVLEMIPQSVLNQYNIIALDARGTGYSAFSMLFQKEDSNNTLMRKSHLAAKYISTSTFIQDIESLRQHLQRDLKTESIHLLGYSYGTRAYMAYAAKYPDYVASMILNGLSNISNDDFFQQQYEKILYRLKSYNYVWNKLPKVLKANQSFRSATAFKKNFKQLMQSATLKQQNGLNEFAKLTLYKVPSIEASTSSLEIQEKWAMQTINCADYNPNFSKFQLNYAIKSNEVLRTNASAKSRFISLVMACNDMKTQKNLALPKNLSEDLMYVDAPVLIINSTYDPLTPNLWAINAQTYFPHAKRIEVLNETKHSLVFLGYPQIDERVIEFLKKREAYGTTNKNVEYIDLRKNFDRRLDFIVSELTNE